MATIRTIATAIKAISVRILRRIRSPYGSRVDGPSKKDAHKRLGSLERWSGWATLLILAGILLDIAILWWRLPWFSERIWATLANAFIGLGLMIEYIVIGRTIVASGEVKRESDAKIAAALERAAEAEARAAETERDLVKYRRRRMLRPDQIGLIGSRIRHFRPKWDMGIADPHNEEQVDFANVLGNLIHAYWVSQLWKGGEFAVVIPAPGTTGVVRASDVSVQIHPDNESWLTARAFRCAHRVPVTMTSTSRPGSNSSA
jgi:hypothetical protein